MVMMTGQSGNVKQKVPVSRHVGGELMTASCLLARSAGYLPCFSVGSMVRLSVGMLQAASCPHSFLHSKP